MVVVVSVCDKVRYKKDKDFIMDSSISDTITYDCVFSG